MRQLLILASAVLLALLVGAGSAASGTEFAVGSAKTDAEAFAGLEHMSFSAHSYPPVPIFPPNPCAARGSIVYDTPTLHMKVDVQELVISSVGATAYIAGPVAWATDGTGNPIYPPVPWAQFDVFDREALSIPPSDTYPDADAFQFDGFFPPSPCRAPTIASHVLTSGNIVIKAEGPLLLP